MILYKTEGGVTGYNFDDIMFELTPSGLSQQFKDWFYGKTGFIYKVKGQKPVYCVYKYDYELFIKNYGN